MSRKICLSIFCFFTSILFAACSNESDTESSSGERSTLITQKSESSVTDVSASTTLQTLISASDSASASDTRNTLENSVTQSVVLSESINTAGSAGALNSEINEKDSVESIVENIVEYYFAEESEIIVNEQQDTDITEAAEYIVTETESPVNDLLTEEIHEETEATSVTEETGEFFVSSKNTVKITTREYKAVTDESGKIKLPAIYF